MSLTLAAVPTTVCTRPDCASRPMCAVIPKCHWLGEVGVDLFEQRLGEVVVQQQAPELEQRGGVRQFARQVDAHEVAQCLAVVQGIFQRFVCQAVPLLQAINAQHPGHTNRLTTKRPLVGYSGSNTAIKRV